MTLYKEELYGAYSLLYLIHFNIWLIAEKYVNSQFAPGTNEG